MSTSRDCNSSRALRCPRQLALIFTLTLAGAPPARAQAPLSLLSISPAAQPGNGASGAPAASADGKRVAFASEATNLVAGDNNNVSDVFLRDVAPAGAAAKTQRVSLSATDEEGIAASDQPAISRSGNVVAFRSLAKLVTADTNDGADIYLRDLSAGLAVRTELVSVATGGGAANGESFGPPALDTAGSVVAFLSRATNLSTIAGNAFVQAYVRDRVTGKTELVSVSLDGKASDGDASAVSVSGDGRLVAFASSATNLSPGDGNLFRDIFIWHRVLGQTAILSVGPGRRAANGPSDSPSISADGRIIAFASQASNLSPDDRDALWDIYAVDRVTGQIELASRKAPNLLAGDSTHPSIALGGRLVAFQSTSAFSTSDTNQASDAYLYDRAVGDLTLLSHTAAYNAGNGASSLPSLADGGTLAAFQSEATDLGADANNTLDVFSSPLSAEVVNRFLLTGGLLFRLGDDRLVLLRPDGTYSGSAISPVANEAPISVTLDGEGVVWALGATGRIRRFRGDTLEAINQFVVPGITPFAADLAAAGGFAFISTSTPPGIVRVSRFGDTLPIQFSPNTTGIALTLDPSGRLWAAVTAGGTGRILALSLDLEAVRSFRTRDSITQLVSDDRGALLGLAAGAVVKHSPLGAEIYRVAVNSPLAIAVDGEGNLAVLHRNAALFLDPDGRTLLEIPHAQAIPAGKRGAVVLDGTGRAWFSVEGAGSLRRIDRGLGKQGAVDFPLSVAGANSVSGVDRGSDRSGLITANVIAPLGDLDGDRLFNRAEIESGYDPLDSGNPALLLRVLPVTLLAGQSAGANRVELSWWNPSAFSGIEVTRDGKAIDGSPFPGNTYHLIDTAPGGVHLYEVQAVGEGGGGGEAVGPPQGGAQGGGQGGATANSLGTVIPQTVGDGSLAACVDVPGDPYALAFFPSNGGRLVVSGSGETLPLFDLNLTPVTTGFPHPLPGAEIRGIEYDPSAANGRLLFLFGDGRVFQSALDGSGATQVTTFNGGPAPSSSGYSGLAMRGSNLYSLLGPGYDCLVGFQSGTGAFQSDVSIGTSLELSVATTSGPSVVRDQLYVGLREGSGAEPTDVFRLDFNGNLLTDPHVNMPLGGLNGAAGGGSGALTTDLEYVPGVGLFAIDAANRRLCLLSADMTVSPIIETMSPAAGPAAGGTTVTLLVRNLRSRQDTRALVGGNEVPILTFVDGADAGHKILTFATPVHTDGAARVEVVSSDGRSFVDPGFNFGSAFVRGNADGLGRLDITDALFILNFLFLGAGRPPCMDAADFNDDGKVDITDATNVLNFLFLGGDPPPPPFPNPGADPTADTLGC